uniref:Aamy domain-containing protein n=1 Tax=Panagrellus redivivus TaxID=6233 RepID=A0A7E4VPW9_PANRE
MVSAVYGFHDENAFKCYEELRNKGIGLDITGVYWLPVLHGEPEFEPKHPNQTNRVGSASNGVMLTPRVSFTFKSVGSGQGQTT